MIISILSVAFVFAIAFLWACCIVAKRADENIEKMWELKLK